MSIIVYGPQGCGKTKHAEALRVHFNCAQIIDEAEWPKTSRDWTKFKSGSDLLLVTDDEKPTVGTELDRRVYSFEEAAADDANIIFGTVIDDALGDEVRVTVIAAGFDGGQPPRRQPGITRAPDLRQSRPATQAPATPAPQPTFARPEPTPAPEPVTRPQEQPQERPAAPYQPRPAALDDDLDVPEFLK